MKTKMDKDVLEKCNNEIRKEVLSILRKNMYTPKSVDALITLKKKIRTLLNYKFSIVLGKELDDFIDITLIIDFGKNHLIVFPKNMFTYLLMQSKYDGTKTPEELSAISVYKVDEGKAIVYDAQEYTFTQISLH